MDKGCESKYVYSVAYYATIFKLGMLYLNSEEKYKGGTYMLKKELLESVGKYIDKYYIPATDDIRMDKEMKSIFQKITEFRKNRKMLKDAKSEKTGLYFEKDALERKRETIAQSELNPAERKLNLKDAFSVKKDFTGKTVLLVDDIFTTGTTCNECAKELYRAGAKEVVVFSLSAAGTKER